MSRHRRKFSAFETRTFGWDYVSFEVPSTWEFSVYRFRKGVAFVEFDDDFSIRLQAEWIRPRRKSDVDAAKKRYDKSARIINQDAEETRRVDGLPDEWAAALYFLPNGRELLTALYLSPKRDFFLTLSLRAEEQDTENLEKVVQRLAATIRFHTEGAAPWRFYDIALDLPVEWKLRHTDFETGKKLLVFDWRRRRFCIWHIALADRLLEKHPRGVLMADILNFSRIVKGIRFAPDGEGGVVWRRSRRNYIGHYDEISRWCFDYRIALEHDAERNRLLLWCFNFRNAADLDELARVRVSGAPLAIPHLSQRAKDRVVPPGIDDEEE